jgi:uncharacterized protein
LNDAAFALDHLPAKLLTLADGFRTVAVRLLAAQRRQVIHSFFEDVSDKICS